MKEPSILEEEEIKIDSFDDRKNRSDPNNRRPNNFSKGSVQNLHGSYDTIAL